MATVDDIAPLAVARLRLSAARVERRFWLILAGSLAFHAALFGLVSGQRKAMPPLLPSIVASLRLVSITESGASAPAQAVAAPLPTKVRPMPAPAVARAAPPVLATAGPASAPASAPASFAASESLPAAAPAVCVLAAPGPVSTEPAARPQSEVLDGYRRRLAELLARHQEYPRIAALRGWEGEVRLRLKVARRGNLLGVQVDRSSGYAVLDQHALAMLEALAGLPPLPDALEGNEIQVVVPIHYKLKKTT